MLGGFPLRGGGIWGLILWLVITLRLGLGLVALLSIHLQPITVIGGDWTQLVIATNKPWSELLSPWQRWDALWFQRIAETGYHAGDGSVHFQPLFPLLSRLVSVPLLGSVVLAELAVSTVSFAAALWLLYRLARMDADETVARLALLLTAVFPVAFFFFAPYSESLYLALTLAAFWFARQGRPWLAGIAGFGAGLTRLVGIFLIFPLAFEYLRQRDEQPVGTRLRADSGGASRFGLLASTLPALGLIVTVLWDRDVVGEQRSPLTIASYWGDRIVPPWQPLPDSWLHIYKSGDAIEILNFACLLVFSVLALAALRRLPLTYGLYTLPYLAFMFSRESFLTPFESVSRYVVVLFPCFIMLAVWLARRPAVAASWLIISVLLEAVILDYWVHFGFVA